MQKKNLEIPELCPTSSPWVVVALGRVCRNPDPRRIRDFQIEVHVAELDSALTDSDRLPKSSSLLRASRRTVLTPVGNLRKLIIGSIWVSGQKIRTCADELLEFRAQPIDASKADNLRPLGLSCDDKRYSVDFLINPFHLFVPLAFARARCVTIDIPPQSGRPQTAIIPCAEVIRYFFAGRKNQILELFSDGLNQDGNRLYNPAHLRPIGSDKTAHIRLRLGMGEGAAAWLPARIAYEPRVRHAALAIAGKLHGKLGAINSSQSDETGDAFPHGLIPELSPDKVKMRGKRVQDRDGNWVFFVFEIMHFDRSSATRIFTTVEYEHDVERGGSQLPTDGDKPAAFDNWHTAPAKLRDDVKDVTIHKDGPTCNDLDPIAIEDEEEISSFAAPADVVVKKAPKRPTEFRSLKRRPTEEVDGDVSSNPDGTDECGLSRYNEVFGQQTTSPYLPNRQEYPGRPILTKFIALLWALNEHHRVTISPASINTQPDDPTNGYAAKITEYELSDSDHSYLERAGKPIPREFYAAELYYSGSYSYLIDLERPETSASDKMDAFIVIWKRDHGRFVSFDFSLILKRYFENRSWKCALDGCPELIGHRIFDQKRTIPKDKTSPIDITPHEWPRRHADKVADKINN